MFTKLWSFLDYSFTFPQKYRQKIFLNPYFSLKMDILIDH